MRRRFRAAGMSVGLLLAPAAALPEHAIAQTPGTIVAAPAAVRDRLAEDAVWRDAYARRELWTWTTAEQVAALRLDPRLLTRSESPTHGPSAFDLRVREHLARTSSPISRLLQASGLGRRRFAWSAPWATVLGMGDDETYGDRLVRLVLRPEAIVGRFLDGARDPWSFSDLQGRNVPARTVLRDPSRLAAVYHERTRTSYAAAGSYTVSGVFREHVVVNESMIERWEVATPAVIARLERDLALLRALAPELARLPAASRELPAGWVRRPVRPTFEQLYAAAIALPTELFARRRDVAVSLAIEALEHARVLAVAGPPLEATPPREFTLGSAPWVRPQPPRPPPRRGGTYLGSFGPR